MEEETSFGHVRERLSGFRFRAMSEAAERCGYTEKSMWRILGDMIAGGEAAAMVNENGWAIFFDPLDISSEDLAAATGLSQRTIQGLADEIARKGFGKKIGRAYVFRRSAIEYVRARPENRGAHFRKKQASEA